MYIRFQWTIHKMGCLILNNMTIIKIKILSDLLHITLLYTIIYVLNDENMHANHNTYET